MSWTISPAVDELIKKALAMDGLTVEEAEHLLTLDLCSREVYALMEAAAKMTRLTFGNKGERHYHIGLNVEQCRFDCRFCSLTPSAGIFTEPVEFSREQVLTWARDAEAKGADALNIMTTGTYGFQKLLECGRYLKAAVSVPLVANTRDISHKEGEALLEAGFVGCYHAVRLGEGRDTPFKPEARRHTVQVFRDLGLKWMNCVEPVGPEHQKREIAELMVFAREQGATYSGVMRRINFPGSPMEPHGMINEREMARMVAVSRLVMGDVPRAHCTHEPNTAALLAGANLFFPECGSSPRDLQADSAKGRGSDLDRCARILDEMGLDPLLPSNCFGPEARLHAPGPCPSDLYAPLRS
ncbi:MAG: radical SAM protein [Proteobacteria bacterium]|nr:radical SAM protein [Pseudomonadota bacterium]